MKVTLRIGVSPVDIAPDVTPATDLSTRAMRDG
jgi:hypothetical protein